MDQIREQVTRVLDKQGVLSRLKAELRANVFLAINDQDIRQGGVGLGSKSDATHRQLLTADPSGVLLLELVRELMQWSKLQFTQQVFEQEMQLGPATPLDLLQEQMGPLVNADVDQPLLLQLLKQVTDSSSSNWHAAAAKADPPHQQSSRAAGEPTATAAAGSRHSSSLPRQQLQDGSAAAPEAAPVPVEAKASAGQLETDVCNAASAASKLPSKSTSLLGTASVAEDSSLIGTQLSEEDTSQEYATVLLPKHHTSSSAGLDDEASSASSTYPVDTPRITARPARAQAAAAGPAQQAQVSTLRPAGQHAPLPPLVARPAPAQPPAESYTAAEQDGGNADYGMAGACELTDSFGHERSFGDSSLELQGLESPPRGTAAGARAAAARAIDAEASYSSRSSSSGDGSSRALSPAEGDPVPGAELQQPAAAGQERLPAVRAPGKLTPLPPVGSGSGSASGLSKRNSDGLRDELLRAGLLAPQPPAAPAADATQQQLEAEGSADSRGSASDSKAPAAAAGSGARMSDDSQASSNITDSQEYSSWRTSATAAAGLSRADRQQEQGAGGMQHAGSLGRNLSQGDGNDSEDDSDDDFGVRGQQQLLEAARRQLSNRSRSSSQGLGLQQQQQRAGEMQVEVSGASLTLTSSGELDDDMIPEDISLPIDALMDGSEYSGLFEPAQPAGPPAGGQSNAWASTARTGAGAAGAGAPAGLGSRGTRQQAAQQALELTDDEDSDGGSDREQPLAAAGGFSIDDDDF